MKRTAIVFTVLMFCAIAFAQSDLRLGIVVTDDKGAPVTDLKPGDIAVEAAGKLGEMQTLPARDTTVAPSGEMTNRNTAVLGRGLVIVMLDTMHTRYLDERELRPAIAKYAAALAAKNEAVELLVLTPEATLQVIHDYTSSPKTLSAAYERADAIVHKKAASAEASAEITAETNRMVDFLKGATANNTAPNVGLRARPDDLLMTFKNIADATAGIPGRKALVWIANIAPFSVEDRSHLFASMGMMNDSEGSSNLRSGVTRRELMTEDEVKATRPLWKSAFNSMLRADLALYPVGVRAASGQQFDPEMLNAIKVAASITGGREVHSVGDPFSQLLDVGDQNLAAYEVDTPLNQSCGKGEWCDLKVTVKRAGLKVSAPMGYFLAGKDKKDKTDNTVATALATPFDFTGVPFTLQWAKTEAAGDKKKVGFIVVFPTDSGIPSASSNDLNLEIWVRAWGPKGEVKKDANFNAQATLPQDNVNQMRQHGFSLNNTIELPPGDYTMKFLVRDKVTNRLGSITVPLKVS